MLKVTKVWINKWEKGKLLGFANIDFSLDGSDETHLRVSDFKLFKGDNGQIQVGLPSRKDEKGAKDENGQPKYYPTVRVIRSEDKDGPGDNLLAHIEQEATEAYNNLGGQSSYNKKSSGSGDAPDGIPW